MAEYSLSPRKEYDKGLILNFINSISNNASPLNFGNQTIYPITEKHMDCYHPFSKSFIFPTGNVNPLHTMVFDNSTPQNAYFSTNQHMMKEYHNIFQNSIQNNANNFNFYEQQTFLDNNENSNEVVSVGTKSKLPKLNIEMINYSDSSKIMSDRMITDYMNNNEDKNSCFWQNIISNKSMKVNNNNLFNKTENIINNSNLSPSGNLINSNATSNVSVINTDFTGRDYVKEEFQVIKPSILLANNLSPTRNDCSINDLALEKKERNFEIFTPIKSASHMLSLNVSPKSAFVVKSVNK